MTTGIRMAAVGANRGRRAHLAGSPAGGGAAGGVGVRAGARTGGPRWEDGAVSTAEFGQVNEFPSPFRFQAYRAVSAVVSDDHNFERGVETARATAYMVLTEHGRDGRAEVAVELSLALAEALGRIAAEQGLTS